jgi:hypothetical protein
VNPQLQDIVFHEALIQSDEFDLEEEMGGECAALFIQRRMNLGHWSRRKLWAFGWS